jgi:hypothetical protein
MRAKGIYFSGRYGGPVWTRDRGYHTPAPLPQHIKQILMQPAPAKEREPDETPEPKDSQSR